MDRDERPWGRFEVLTKGEGFQVKRITVIPGGRLSLQRHQHRSERWVVASGKAVVTRDQEIHRLNTGDMIEIPLHAVHRLENESDADLEIIEVQLGAILREDDIERLEDVYGRD